MNKDITVEAIDAYNLSDRKRFGLNVINEIKEHFNSKIQERKVTSKELSKYIAAFGYISKTLISLSAASGAVSILSFASVIGAPAGITSASVTLLFSLKIGIANKLLRIIICIIR